MIIRLLIFANCLPHYSKLSVIQALMTLNESQIAHIKIMAKVTENRFAKRNEQIYHVFAWDFVITS